MSARSHLRGHRCGISHRRHIKKGAPSATHRLEAPFSLVERDFVIRCHQVRWPSRPFPFAERFRRPGPDSRQNYSCGQRTHNWLVGVEHPFELPRVSVLSRDSMSSRGNIATRMPTLNMAPAAAEVCQATPDRACPSRADGSLPPLRRGVPSLRGRVPKDGGLIPDFPRPVVALAKDASTAIPCLYRQRRRSRLCRALVRAALRAAAERPAAPFVFAALRDADERSAAERRRAAEEACRDNACGDAALCPSRLSASRTARDRVADVFAGRLPCASAFFALRRVLAAAFPFFGAANFTPARRAFERPMAIACLADRAPCLPSRTWCISSRTNSPACVDGALPWRASACARSSVFFSGMSPPDRLYGE